ncbi:MAG: methylenetetrahydrofolate reductase [NAD(P)H] [Aquificaceae bacterium]|nr:methylenetetrahydrofolate reductase [NAD(P)H] [Aquificaceae bacterium]
MKIIDHIKKGGFSLSFEFFPPKDEGGKLELIKTLERVRALNPTFVSVTYGAGGSTRERTKEVVSHIHKELGMTVMVHLTCIAHSAKELFQIVSEYEHMGIENLLALRGDMPKDSKVDVGCKYALEMVKMIRERFENRFCIAVAAYPEGHIESGGLENDIKNFVKKVKAGADFAITQMFFDNAYFFRFMDMVNSEGVDIPILPGIMPITNFKQVEKFAKMCGASIPDRYIKALEPYQDNQPELIKRSVELTTMQCLELLKNGVKGLHFYTLNRSSATLEIVQNLSSEMPSYANFT